MYCSCCEYVGQFYPKKLVGRSASLPKQEERVRMNSNTTLENQLNAAIAERGYRISPRADLSARLARYIQLKYSANGRVVDTEEAQAAAAMMMMKFSDVSLEEPLPKRRRTVSVQEDGNINVTIGGGHCMTRRSQVNSAKRSSPSPAPVAAEGTHSMVRRSQVARR
jgi:hypothetical protein